MDIRPIAMRSGVGVALLAVASYADQLPAVWEGLKPGPYKVGVRFTKGIDYQRTYKRGGFGTEMLLTVWYPAAAGASGVPVTQASYYALQQSAELSAERVAAAEEAGANMAVSWRHVGIVDQTKEQALQTMRARAYALRGAEGISGKFPVVLASGGPFLMNTTAEYLATHGYLVIAVSRFDDPYTDLSQPREGEFMEPNVRDLEWALEQLVREPVADTGRIAVMGHGGGGMSAMLLAMRNAAISACVLVDAGNFSSRSNYQRIPFTNRARLRVPMLNITTEANRRGQDQYEEFGKLRYSDRYEVVLTGASVRHHDLSNFGRGVSAVLKIRGPEQELVLDRYAAAQNALLTFLEHVGTKRPAASLKEQLSKLAGDSYTLTLLPALTPPPGVAHVVEQISNRGVAPVLAELRVARERDPEADLFMAGSLATIANRLTRSGKPDLAREYLVWAQSLHPESTALKAEMGNVQEALRPR